MSRKIKLNFTPFLRRIYVVSCNPARLSCACFAVPLWVRRWLLSRQNNEEQYSDTPTVDRYTTDSQSQHIGRHVGRHSRPICRPTGSRHVDRVSADMSTDRQPTCRPSIGRYVDRPIGRYLADISAESVDRQRSLLHMIRLTLFGFKQGIYKSNYGHHQL